MMKWLRQTVFALCFQLASASAVFAQASTQPILPPSSYDAYSIFFHRESGSFFGGGIGISVFGNQVFYTISLAPELALGNWGVGLDVNLRISQQGQLRREDWEDGVSSYLRLVRYVRYGVKRDSLYFRIGQLDAARLGHGTILFLYRNNASYDARRIGVEWDMDFGNYGFESMVSDVSTFNVIGVRPFWRPLRELGLPLLSGLELGATVVGDVNENANVQLEDTTYLSGRTERIAARSGALIALGMDASLPLARLPLLNADAYLDAAGIIGYGAGLALGVSGSLKNLLGLVVLSAKLEQRFLTDRFQFAYFDALYEQERYREQGERIISRANQLRNTVSGGAGIYGELGGAILGKFQFFGSYQRLYRTPRGGILQLSARLEDLIPAIVLRADYFKRDIGAETDLFTLNERSLAQVEFGYSPYPYLLLSLVYQWTFLPVRSSNNAIVRYEPVQRIEPRVLLRLQF
ncbi:MAG: hypothetical protein RMI34_10485 [Chloroherpetonaceae bacterium]|nr:hypothetical protein [Chloroherpetonaceae bacterium]